MKSKTFPPVGTIDDNLKQGDQVYRFNTECYQKTKKQFKTYDQELSLKEPISPEQKKSL